MSLSEETSSSLTNECSNMLCEDDATLHMVSQTTETDDIKAPECAYCLRRMSVLRQIEQIKCAKRLECGIVSRQRPGERRNHSTQTPAAFFEAAEMSYQEILHLRQILASQHDKRQHAETFCQCVASGWEKDCRCGEENQWFEWTWDQDVKGTASKVKEHGSLVVFHEDYSCGTTAVRGVKAMDKDQHFWEIKMTTPVYGTDMMIGVGTRNVELNKYHNTFCSMLGCDLDSWGISYDGRLQHAGKKKKYCCRFGQGTIIGVHLDMWHGTLTFFKNRRSLGVAFGGLRGRTLYPMVCSTAARSGMRVIFSRSYPSSLQFLCCQKLRCMIPSHLSVLKTVPMAPGLRSFLNNNMAWLLDVPHMTPPDTEAGAICKICSPLKGLLEDHWLDSDILHEDRISQCIKLQNSDDDSDEDSVEDFSERSLQRHSLARYLIEASFRSLTHSNHLTTPPPSMAAGTSTESTNSNSPGTSAASSSKVKKARLELSSIPGENEDTSEEEDDEYLDTNVGHSLPQLGKRKHR